MPLPMMGPEYVNCYILYDGQAIALVDTGANIGDCKNIWENILHKNFPKKKISNVCDAPPPGPYWVGRMAV